MKIINLLHYALLGVPVVLFLLSLIFVMGQGKKDFMGMIKRGTNRTKRKLALVVVLSILYGAAWLGQDQLKLSMQGTAVIGFNYPEASRGLTPNKTRLNASEILSGEVLETAIKNAGMDISAQELRECLKVTPVKAGSTISTDTTYISTEYLLTYTANKDTLSLNPQTVVDMVAHAYYDKFIADYTRKTIVLEPDFDELEDLDYLDIDGWFDVQAKAIEDYAWALSSENSTYQSATTGETFYSVAEKAKNYRDVQLERYKSYILTYGIAKNKPQYIAKLNYDNKITSIDYLKNVATHTINLEAIDLYERDMATIVLVPSEDTDGKYYMSRTKIGVDYFADEAETSMQTAAQQQLQVETNNYTIQQMQSVDATAEQSAQADEMVESLKSEYQVLSDLMKNTLKDYDKDTTNNYMSIIVSEQEKIGSSDLKKVIVVMAGFAVFFSLLLTVFPYREQPSGNGKEKKNGKKGKEPKQKRAKLNNAGRNNTERNNTERNKAEQNNAERNNTERSEDTK